MKMSIGLLLASLSLFSLVTADALTVINNTDEGEIRVHVIFLGKNATISECHSQHSFITVPQDDKISIVNDRDCDLTHTVYLYVTTSKHNKDVVCFKKNTGEGIVDTTNLVYKIEGSFTGVFGLYCSPL